MQPNAARKKVRQEAAREHNDKVREGRAKAFGPRAGQGTQKECPRPDSWPLLPRRRLQKLRHDHVPMETVQATECKLYRGEQLPLLPRSTDHPSGVEKET